MFNCLGQVLLTLVLTIYLNRGGSCANNFDNCSIANQYGWIPPVSTINKKILTVPTVRIFKDIVV